MNIVDSSCLTTREAKLRNVLTNGIGWELFSGDGRAVTRSSEGVEVIVLTDHETARCQSIADRVLRDLAAFEAQEATA